VALVAVPSETRCWLQCPQTEAKRYTYKGEARAKRVVVGPDSAPRTVPAVAARLPASRWYRRKVSEGTKGPSAYAFARQRVTLRKDGLPDRTVWLVIKRTLGTEPSYTYAISHAPASTPLSTFVWLSGLRWAVEQCFEEGKTELGMDHYAVRTYAGWHHHMLTTMLAHFFLWHLKIHVGEKPLRSRCHKCGGSWKWFYLGRRIGLQTSSRYLPGDSGAITAPICRIESGVRPRAKLSSVVGVRSSILPPHLSITTSYRHAYTTACSLCPSRDNSLKKFPLLRCIFPPSLSKTAVIPMGTALGTRSI